MRIEVAVTPKVVLPGQVPVIHQSMYRTWRACPRLFFLCHVLGIRLIRREVSAAADTGTYWHEYMRSRYVNFAAGTGGDHASIARASVGGQLDEDLRALAKAASEDLSGEVQRVMESLQTAAEKAKVMGDIFWQRHPIHSGAGFSVVDVEKDIVTASGYEETYFGGRLDLVLRDKRGCIWLVDHKSTTRPVSQLVYGRSWAFQAQWYRWLANAVYGTQPAGFVYNLMQQPNIKLCRTDEKDAEKKGITVQEAYLQRCREWYAKQTEPCTEAVWFPCHTRPNIEPVMPILDALSEVVVRSDRSPLVLFPQDGTLLTCRGLGKTCPYLPFCDADPAAWPGIPGFEQRFAEEPMDEHGKEDEDA